MTHQLKAGEIPCATCNGVGMIGYHRGQTAESYEEVTEACPDCTPVPTDGVGALKTPAERFGDALAYYKAGLVSTEAACREIMAVVPIMCSAAPPVDQSLAGGDAWRKHDGSVKSPVDGDAGLFDLITADGRQYNAQRAPRFWHFISMWRPAQPAPAVGSGETAWLIEKDDQGLFYRMATRWTRDVHEALRFSRREDAEAFSAAYEGDQYGSVLEPRCRVVEHRWG